MVRRHVLPYIFVYRVWAKGRWVGRPAVSNGGGGRPAGKATEADLDPCCFCECTAFTSCLSPTARVRDPIRRPLLGVLQKEFSAHSADYYARACRLGFVTVNGEQTDGARLIRHGDRIAHTTHRHEPPVSGQCVSIARGNGPRAGRGRPRAAGSGPLHDRE